MEPTCLFLQFFCFCMRTAASILPYCPAFLFLPCYQTIHVESAVPPNQMEGFHRLLRQMKIDGFVGEYGGDDRYGDGDGDDAKGKRVEDSKDGCLLVASLSFRRSILVSF